MHVHAFIEEMEQLAPPELAEDFDAGKIGLIVEGRKTMRTVCCALDATPSVVKRAVARTRGYARCPPYAALDPGDCAHRRAPPHSCGICSRPA